MTWTRLSDDWTDRADLAALSFEDRWHYLAMVQLCSRGGILTGEMRMVDAKRCSDHPDPAAAITRLVAAELLEVVKTGVRIIEIDSHIPPPSVRNKAEGDKIRKRRQRAHAAGDHSLCLPENCSSLSVTSSVTRDPGTGQDGPDTGSKVRRVTFADEQTGEIVGERVESWAVALIPGQVSDSVAVEVPKNISPARCRVPGCSNSLVSPSALAVGVCRRGDEEHERARAVAA